MLVVAAFADDVIICKDAKRIDAIIVEVSNVEVRYKKASNPTGPTFVIPVADITTIMYSDGEVWVNNAAAVAPAATQTAPATAQAQPTQEVAPATTLDSPVAQEVAPKKGGLKFNPTPVGKKRIFGLTVGYISKQIKYSYEGETEKEPWIGLKEGTSSTALAVGFTLTPEFKYGIGIQTGLYYEWCSEESEGVRASEHALAVPVRLQYRYEIIPDLSIFLYTGPKFDFGLAFPITYDGEKMDVYKEEDAPKRFRMLWGLGAGIQWKTLQLRLGGDWGMTNVYDSEVKCTLVEPFNICLSTMF